MNKKLSKGQNVNGTQTGTRLSEKHRLNIYTHKHIYSHKIPSRTHIIIHEP